MANTRVQSREPSTASKSANSGSLFDSHTISFSFFSTIPPERIGLNGEYDHSGLAKRVLKAFQTHFSTHDLEGLRVAQRGKVVILMGSISSTKVLERLASIAQNVEGAIDVETNGIRFK